MSKSLHIRNILSKPSVLWGALFIAIIIARYFPEIGALFKEPAEIYISLFQMCVIPLVVTSLILSSAQLLDPKSKEYGVAHVMKTYGSVLLIVCLIAVLLAYLLKLGFSINSDTNFLLLTSTDESAQKFLHWDDRIKTSINILDFFKDIFTANIFYSFYNSIMIQIVFSSMIIGFATWYIEHKRRAVFLDFILSLDELFSGIVSWLILFLPFGILFIFSSMFLSLQAVYFYIFEWVILSLITTIITIILILNFFVSKKLKIGYFSVFNQLKDTMIVALSTRSVFATFPIYMETLEYKFNFKQAKVHLFVPITLTLFRFSAVIYFGFIAVLTAQIFAIPLGLLEYCVLILLVLISSFAAVSTGGNLKMLSVILQPIGVPSELIIGFLGIIDSIFDPFRILFAFYMNFFCAVYSYKDFDSEDEIPSLESDPFEDKE